MTTITDRRNAQQLATITALAQRMDARGRPLRRTALQKFVFFLQELYGVECRYEFTLYTYGPFASEILRDLDLLDAKGGVEVNYDAGIAGYDIKPGPEAERFIQGAAAFVEKYHEALDAVTEEFGGSGAKSLELFATVVFVEREAAVEKRSLPKEELVSTVRGLKPHFEEKAIKDALARLTGKGYLTAVTT